MGSADGQSVTKVKYSDSQCRTTTGAYFEFFGRDDQCTMLQGEIPLVSGCFQDSATTSYELSCSGTSGSWIKYSDPYCIAANSVRDLSQCYLERTYPVGLFTISIYARMTQCIIANPVN